MHKIKKRDNKKMTIEIETVIAYSIHLIYHFRLNFLIVDDYISSVFSLWHWSWKMFA